MKGWRTILWNALNAILAGMQSIGVTGYEVPQEYMMAWILVFALVNTGLRLVTDTPVGAKKQ